MLRRLRERRVPRAEALVFPSEQERVHNDEDQNEIVEGRLLDLSYLKLCSAAAVPIDVNHLPIIKVAKTIEIVQRLVKAQIFTKPMFA